MFKNIVNRVTINIKPEELSEFLKEKIQAEFPDSEVKSLTFDVKSRWEGYGVSEHEVQYFAGVDIVLEKSPVSRSLI